MPKIIITDVYDSLGVEDVDVELEADTREELTALLLEDLERTSADEFVDVAMHYYAALANAEGYSFSLSNSNADVRLTDTGNRVRFDYVP